MPNEDDNDDTTTVERNRSVVNFSCPKALQDALCGSPDSASSRDWVLPSFDPDTTEVQTMGQELHRLQALKSYLILDSKREADFERITALASNIFHVPIALVSLVDLGRQWFMSNRGLGDVRETPRKFAFCAHAILSKRRCLVVTDATADFRFKDNPLVTGPPNIRFYAGMPLVSPEGYKLGTLCIIDDKVRPQGLSDRDKDILSDLAAMTVQAMVHRRKELESESPAELIAYAAHDLMTPLMGVQLSLSLLQEDHQLLDKLNKHQIELLTTAFNCSDLMVRICQTTLRQQQQDIKVTTNPNVSTHSTSSSQQQCSSGNSLLPLTSVHDLVNSLSMLLQHFPKQVPLVISLDPSVPATIMSDDLKLFRSALNLLSIAIERTLSGKVHLKIYAQGDHLVFECEDTSEDIIPEEVHQHLFDNSQESCRKLGLSSVATQIRSMCGDYGGRPRGKSPDGTTQVLGKNGRQLCGSFIWFSVPLVSATDDSTTSSSTTDDGSNSISLLQAPELPQKILVGGNSEIPPFASSVTSYRKKSAGYVSSPRRAKTLTLCDGASVLPGTSYNTSTLTEKEEAVVSLPPAGDETDPVVAPTTRACAVEADPNSKAPKTNTGSRTRRALVIEDSAVVRKCLARALKKMHFDVSEAVNGLEGLNLLKETLFDIVFCDFLMPVMDGLDCVKQYRAWENENSPPLHRQHIVGISAHVSEEASGQGFEAGMDSFRPKPITIKTLTEVLSSEAIVARTKLLDRLEGVVDSETLPAVSVDQGTNGQNTVIHPLSPTRAGIVEPNHEQQQCMVRQDSAVSDETPCSPECLIAMDTATLASNATLLNTVKASGWNVTAVHDGTDALRLLQTRNWDVVLIDTDIPNLLSTKFIKEFRDWEFKNRVNEQRNVFFVCDDEIPDPSCDRCCVVQPPSGFSGVLSKPVCAKSMIQQSSSTLKIVL